MASISKAFKNKLAEHLQKNPLKEGEFRRIECLGTYFISLDKEHDGQRSMFYVSVGDQVVHVYRVTG